MSQITRGRLNASHGKAIGGGVWLHLGVSRLDLREFVYDIGRVRAGDEVVIVGLEDALESTEEADGIMVVGSRAGLGLEGDLGGGVDVDSVERVFRFVSFVGDSTGGGKSLGWLRVATMIVTIRFRGLKTEVRRAMRSSVRTKVERGLYEEVSSDVCASDPFGTFTSAHFLPHEGSNLALFQRSSHGSITLPLHELSLPTGTLIHILYIQV